MRKLARVFVVCFIICLVLITSQLSTEPKLCGFIGYKNDDPFSPPTVKEDGLKELSTIKQNDNSCLSRYESPMYRKQSLHKPSSYLVSRLRQYEALHKRCGPYTESYNRTIRKLESGHSIDGDHEPSDCKYLVRVASDGLGNRILSLASAFLYALITNRVLLVYDNKGDTFDLFCEPFPETTWFLPYDFPIRNRLQTLNTNIPEHYGNMLKNSSSSFVYLHLFHGYQNNGRHFFCDQGQIFLQNVTWVFVRSHFYYIPSLFLIESFEQELASLFPEQDKVFHFISRYLFSPSNPVWDLITRYYQAYLAKSDEKIGVQVRVFEPDLASRYYDAKFTSDQAVPDTVVTCLLDNNLLPKIDTNESLTIPKEKGRSIAVLMTSLSSRYFQKIRDMYWEHSSVNHDVIGVFQASFEGNQNFGNKMHDRKAWAEMYLLSLTDKLITSPWSTFGYVAQGLGGLRPYILHMPNNETMSNPACTRAVSMEPCFHSPPIIGCSKDRSKVPHVSQCDDLKMGLKLVDPNLKLVDLKA